MKLTIKDKAEIIKQRLSKKLDTPIDRFGHIKYIKMIDSKPVMYRYKFGKIVIRYERKYSTGWVLIKSFNINKMYEALKYDKA